MLLTALRERLFGTLKIRASGHSLENFINAVYRQGIILWDIQRLSPTELVFKLKPGAFNRLRPIVRRTGIRLKILRKSGVPFRLYRLQRRKGILAGFLAAAAIVYGLSSFVWFIDVEGNKKMSRGQVLSAAGELGLRTGIWRQKVDTVKMSRELKEKLPQTAWVGVSMRGTRVLIEMVEKVDKPPARPGRGNLLAAKTGLVTDVLVLKGSPLVKEGETVKKGQTLIAADKLPAAQGFVRARVWYTGSGTVKLKDEGTTPTGNTSSGVRIKFGTKVIILTGKKIPFALYQQEESVKSLPKWRNLTIPVEVITVTYHELEHYAKTISREEGTEEAKAKAESDLAAKLPPDAKVVNRRVSVIKENDNNLATVHIDVETVEEIAVHQGT